MITAKEARFNSYASSSTAHAKEMKDLEDLIRDCSLNGRRDAFRVGISEKAEKDLIGFGFVVQRDGILSKIMW